MSRAVSLCRDLGILVKRNINRLCHYMTTEPARLAGIPALWCRDPGWKFSKLSHMPGGLENDQARNRTAGNTLFMRIASNLYIKIAAPGWPFSCNTRIKVILAKLASPAHVTRPLPWVVLTRSLHVKVLEFVDRPPPPISFLMVRPLVWENTT